MTRDPQRMFDETVQITHEWIRDLAQRMMLDDRHKAYAALRIVLHELRDHLPPAGAAHLAAQMPMLVRGFYYEGWNPAVTPVSGRSRTDFLNRVGEHLADPKLRPEMAVHAVLSLLSDRLTEGQIEKVRRSLPAGVRTLWRSPDGEGD